jgi:hypothetical protein
MARVKQVWSALSPTFKRHSSLEILREQDQAAIPPTS